MSITVQSELSRYNTYSQGNTKNSAFCGQLKSLLENMETNTKIEIDDFCKYGFAFLASSYMALTDFNALRLLLKRYQEQSGLIPSWESWNKLVGHINESDYVSFAFEFNCILKSQLFEKLGDLMEVYRRNFSENMQTWFIGRHTTISADKMWRALLMSKDDFQRLVDVRGWARTG